MNPSTEYCGRDIQLLDYKKWRTIKINGGFITKLVGLRRGF